MNQNTNIPLTVVMRSYNDAALLPATLAALDAQVGVDVSLSVFESASTDNSVEIFEAHGYERITHLKPGEYRSSRVLNQGVRDAETEVVVFLNSDAILRTDDSLKLLAEALLSSESCAGVFARQVPRPDASFMTQMEYRHTFDSRESQGAEAEWMTLVCSAVRKSVWERVSFDERLTYAEDAVWSARVWELNLETRYVAEAVAEHSHEYTWGERYKRSYSDAAALAVIAKSGPKGVVGGFLLTLCRRVAGLSLRIVRTGKLHQLPVGVMHLYPLILGQWRGARDGWRHFQGAPDGGSDLQPLVER